MARYDPDILLSFSARMYRRAALVVILWTVLWGVLFGGGAKAFLAFQSQATLSKYRIEPDACFLAITAVGMLLGLLLGLERAFWLKLKAQVVLCQLQTEINTRGWGQPPSSPDEK